MKQGLLEMKEKLQLERQELLNKLQEIDDDLTSINRVMDLVGKKAVVEVDKQLKLIEPEPETTISGRFSNCTFRQAIAIIFNENPGKHWKPGEIADVLMEGDFPTKSKKFKNTVRTLLSNFRKNGDIVATETKGGWLYNAMKEKDSVLHVRNRV